MLSSIKIYLMGGLVIASAIFAFLFKNEQLKRKTEHLKAAKKTAQINNDVARILASRDVKEVLKRVRKEIKNGDVSSLDG